MKENYSDTFNGLDDRGGDRYLELAEELIAQGEFDKACENLLLCIDADTMVRESAYPLIVDLLSKGHCIDMIPHNTFEWLRFCCYIEPDKKKEMYRGIAFGTEKLDKIANALDCYILDFGGDKTVGEMYDRLEELTYEQMPYVDYYDYFYYKEAHDALCLAVENGLPLSVLSDYRLIGVYFHTESEDVVFEILKFVYENGKRDLWKEQEVFSSYKDDNENIKNAIVRFFDYYIEEKNYKKLAFLYSDITSGDNAQDVFGDYDEVNEKIHTRVYKSVLATKDVKTVADFFETANEATYLCAELTLQKELCDFVIKNYLDENGSVREEWSAVSDLIESMFIMLVDNVFFIAAGDSELESIYGGYDKRVIKLVFEQYHNMFDELLTNEVFFNERIYEEEDGLYFLNFDECYVSIDNKEVFLSNVKATLKTIEEKYF